MAYLGVFQHIRCSPIVSYSEHSRILPLRDYLRWARCESAKLPLGLPLLCRLPGLGDKRQHGSPRPLCYIPINLVLRS